MGLSMLFLCCCLLFFHLPSSSLSFAAFVSGYMQGKENNVEEGQMLYDIKEHMDFKDDNVSAIKEGLISTDHRGRGLGGSSSSPSSSHGNVENYGGETASSKSTYKPGSATAVIPIYTTADAAYKLNRNHRHKRNAAAPLICNHNFGLFTAFRFAILVALVLYICATT